MKILLVLMVVLCLVVMIGLCWMSFKMLRETQQQAKTEREEKRKDAVEQSSIDK